MTDILPPDSAATNAATGNTTTKVVTGNQANQQPQASSQKPQRRIRLPLPRRKPKTAAEIGKEAEMTVIEHLAELRSRLTKAAIALIIASAASLYFTNQIINITIVNSINTLKERYPRLTINPVIQNPTDYIGVYMKIAITAGAIFAMPVIVYQLIAFAAPGLTPREKRFVYTGIPFVTVAFLLGVCFGYFVVVPNMLDFLVGFGPDAIERQYNIVTFYDLIIKMLFWIGVIFETPFIMLIMVRVNVVKVDRLRKYRKYAFLVSTVLGAAISPSPDPINMMIIAIPIYILYEFGLLISSTGQREFVGFIILTLVIIAGGLLYYYTGGNVAKLTGLFG